MTMKFTIVGSGYVGSAMAALLCKNHEVVVLDVNQDRVDSINNRKSPIEDRDIDLVFQQRDIHLKGTTDKRMAYDNPDFVVIATPTNYDADSGYFDTRTVESVIRDVFDHSPKSYVVIKSTIPIGFVDSMRSKYNTQKIAFSPEFLREGSALHDNLFPSRIIIGDDGDQARRFAEILEQASSMENVPKLFMSTKEAESVKLFANTYLAMRVSFFNELDSFALKHDLDASNIIEGVTHEPRIGSGYCNPSFGYGGYCFPKDTKQLLANFKDVPQTLIEAIVRSNGVRKQTIADEICSRLSKSSTTTVGVYRLAMKAGSDNFRDAAILDIMRQLKMRKIDIIIYEPIVESFEEYKVVNNIDNFANEADLIIANRVSNDHRILFGKKLFTRDVFGNDA